jgi:hypothetical protein
MQRIAPAFALGFALVALAFWWLRPDSGRPPAAGEPQATGAAPAPSPDGRIATQHQAGLEMPGAAGAEAAPRAPGAAEPAGEAASGHTGDHANDASVGSDLQAYAARPLSAVPHQVVSGWGSGSDARTPGVVGLLVVVDPGLPTEQLEQLARDIRAYHADKRTLNARVLDSEEAATYDRHLDGGALLQRHLVAEVRHDRQLAVDSIRIRGQEIILED